MFPTGPGRQDLGNEGPCSLPRPVPENPHSSDTPASHCMWVPFRPLGLGRASRVQERLGSSPSSLVALHVLWKFMFAQGRLRAGRCLCVPACLVMCFALAWLSLQLIIKMFGPFLLDHAQDP